MDTAQRSSFRALLLAVFVSSIPATLILPMMPSFGTAFGISATQLGLLVGIYPLTSMLVSPFWGRMSDRYGRKPILIATLLGGALAFTVFAFSTSWLGLLIGRAMQGLAGTPRGVGFAVASDVSDRKELSGRMGEVTAAMAIAFTIGPIIGGLFMGENPDSMIGQLRTAIGLPGAGFNHVMPSLLGITVNLIAAVVIIFRFRESWHPDDYEEKEREPGDHRRQFSDAIFHAAVIVAILFFLISGFIQGSLQFAFAMWADLTMNWSAQYIAWSGALIGLGFAVGSGALLKPMTRRFGAEKTVFAGTLIDAFGLAVFLLFQGETVIALTGLFVSSMGNGFWATTILTLLSREIDERDQGLALGFANGASLLGRVLGPAFAGYLAVTMSPGAPFAFLFACVLLAVVRGAQLIRPPRP
ncbi:MAG: MFS transporter [Gammaproteobacteria bacterium]|nr:MFS transporter [Gammaproteobacteria bacterium]NND55030.1 MFS transporter [Gammaproteobacteria bacterium]